MPYTVQSGDEGIALFLAALRDFITTETALTAYTAAGDYPAVPLSEQVLPLLPNGAASVLPEGFLTDTTPTPAVLLSVIGDGNSAYGRDVQLVRLLVYVLDRGRGYYEIERILQRLRKRLNTSSRWQQFFTFSAGDLQLLHLEATGSTASASYPNWRAEGRALYVFALVRGLTTADL